MGDNFLFTKGKRVDHRPIGLIDTKGKVCFVEELETTVHPNHLSQEPSEVLNHPVTVSWEAEAAQNCV